MTTANRLKAALVGYLESVKPDTDLTVVDAQQRAEMDLPTLAVSIASTEAHSVALAAVNRCTVEIKLRTHAGDESLLAVQSVIDQLESSLQDPSQIKALVTDDIIIDHWLYTGSTEEWDESVLEVNFEAECLCRRI